MSVQHFDEGIEVEDEGFGFGDREGTDVFVGGLFVLLLFFGHLRYSSE